MNVDLRGCIAGRKEAWDEFVRQSAPIIFAAVNRSMRGRTQHSHDVNDRVQEVYVRLLREECRLLRTFDPGRASLPTWLSLIARTIVHEHHQKRRQPLTGLETLDGAAPATASPIGPSARHDAALVVPLDCLSAQQRQVIQMLFEQDMSVEQAAARLGVDPQTIRSAKHKALTRLREQMFGSRANAGQPPSPAAGDPSETQNRAEKRRS